LAALGLRCCSPAFFSCGEQGLLSSCCVRTSQCHGFCCRAPALGTWASAIVAHQCGSCGTWAEVSLGMRNLPGLRIKPVCPALAGSLSLNHQGSPQNDLLKISPCHTPSPSSYAGPSLPRCLLTSNGLAYSYLTTHVLQFPLFWNLLAPIFSGWIFPVM